MRGRAGARHVERARGEIHQRRWRTRRRDGPDAVAVGATESSLDAREGAEGVFGGEESPSGKRRRRCETSY